MNGAAMNARGRWPRAEDHLRRRRHVHRRGRRRRRRPARVGKALTTPAAALRGAARRARRRPRPARPRARRALAAHGPVRLRDDARDQRDPRGQDRPHGAALHRRASPTSSSAARAARCDPFDFRRPLPGALRAAPAHVRDPGADRRGGRCRRGRSTRQRGARASSPPARRAGRGGRRLPALVDRQPGARAARSASSSRRSCPGSRTRSRTSSTRSCASTAAPPRGDRRLAEAADAAAPARDRRATPRARLRGRAARRDLARRRDAARGPGRAPDLLGALGPGAGAGRRAAPTPAPSSTRTTSSSATPAARASTSAWSAAASVVTTRETWLGEPLHGHLTGLSSVDVRTIGAGGGSIAWVDSGGLLRVGPQSAGRRARARPATGAAASCRRSPTPRAVLGYLDPDHFLGGEMRLDLDAARTRDRDPRRRSARARGGGLAVITVANEQMVAAIHEITVNQGVDPREAALVAGGGAAGLNIAPIARELGCRRVLLPRSAGALSAFGGQHADIVTEAGRSLFTDSALVRLRRGRRGARRRRRQARRGRRGARRARRRRGRDRALRRGPLRAPGVGPRDPARPRADRDARRLERAGRGFHRTHERVFAVEEPGQLVEPLLEGPAGRAPRSRRSAGSPRRTDGRAAPARPSAPPTSTATGRPTPSTRRLDAARPRLTGPAMIVEPTTTVVVPPGSSAP